MKMNLSVDASGWQSHCVQKVESEYFPEIYDKIVCKLAKVLK